MSWRHLRISAISQVLLTRFWPNFLDPISWGLNFCEPTFFWTKLVLTQDFFGAKNVLTIDSIGPKNCFEPNIIFLLTQHFFWQIFFGSNIFFDPQFFGTHKFFMPKILCSLTFFRTQNFFGHISFILDTTFFRTQYLFGTSTWDKGLSLSKLTTLDSRLVS